MHQSSLHRKCYLSLPRSLAAGLALTLWLLSASRGWTQSNVLIPLHSFTNSPDGEYPVGNLVWGAGNELYGVTLGGGIYSGGASAHGGTLYKVYQDGSGYQVLHSFSESDTSAGNYGGLPPFWFLTVIQGSDGTLYGTTYAGGTNGAGSLFKLNVDGRSGYTVLHSFGSGDANPQSLIQGNDGALYGTCVNSAVFKINLDGSNYQVLHYFTNSVEGTGTLWDNLTQGSDGTLYSTTYEGGTNASNAGTIFKLNPDGSGFTILHSFNGSTDGGTPIGRLLLGNDGALYGTAYGGGSSGGGTVFKLNPDGSGFTVLHTFTAATDGSKPLAGVVQGVGNVLYGATSTDPNSQGTIYQLNPDGSGFQVLYNLPHLSQASLLLGSFTGGSGALYGTIYLGGSGAQGLLFALLVNPPLTITPVGSQTAGNQTAVFWPSWALNYTLQTSTNLANGPWTTVTNTIPVTGVQFTNHQPAAFFRLVQP